MSDILTRISAALAEQYTVERELGAGGMATVFLATDRKHDRAVAIKVLHPDLGASIGGERFEREIRLAGRLQHPHILGMYDSGAADGLLYYVMPFVQGESLRDRLDREGQLPLDDALQITLEVADALNYAHEQQIVHRDIKPENILLQGGHALVADFGIARAAEEGQKLTQTGMSLGTPAYMSPEQGMGEKVGPTADIYALGCVLFEMLAGEPPFSGKTSSAILAKHVMEQVPSLRIIRQSVPEEVELAIFAALAKAPVDRPQSCAAFAEMLVSVPTGHTSTRLMTMRHTAARRTGMMTSAFGVAAPAPVPLWRRPLAIASVLGLLLIGAVVTWVMTRGATPTLAAVDGLDARRIAVLYFEDQSPGDSLTDLADGLTESLIDALGQVQGLTVISRAGVEGWREATNVGPDSIARALDVGTIVRGSVEPRGDRVRVAVRLVDGNSGADLGDTRTLELAATDVTAIRDSTAQEVATIIREQLGQQVRLSGQRQGTRNTEAWLLLQRAERLRRTAASAPPAEALAMLARADTMLANAEQLDRDWIDPVTARAAIAYDESRKAGLDPIEARDAIARGLEHIERALAQDARDPEALEVRGNLRYWSWLLGLEPDPARAEQLIAAARADYEQSQTAGAYASLSHLYYNVPDAGLSDVNLAAQRAYEKDAFLANAETVLNRLFLSSYDLEQWPPAERWCGEMQRRFPTSFQAPRCQLFLMTSRVGEPDIARAWRLADSTAAMAPESRQEFQRLNSDLLVAAVIARAGLPDSARAVVDRSKGNPAVDPSADLAQFAAFVHVLLGDTTAALDELRTFLAASPRRRASLATNAGWWYRPIEATDGFRRLVGAN